MRSAWLLNEASSEQRAASSSGVDVVTLSGRGDKDLDEALAGLERIDAGDGDG